MSDRNQANPFQAMFSAEVGDDVFGEDPTVNALRKRQLSFLAKKRLFLSFRHHDESNCDQSAHPSPRWGDLWTDISHLSIWDRRICLPQFQVAIRTIIRTKRKVETRPDKTAVRPDQDWLPHSAWWWLKTHAIKLVVRIIRWKKWRTYPKPPTVPA